MPDLKCPLNDYTARHPRTEEAALDLVRHLINQHCDANPDDAHQSGDITGKVDLGLGDIAPISSKGRIDVEADADAGGKY
jgi:hypothetical protein